MNPERNKLGEGYTRSALADYEGAIKIEKEVASKVFLLLLPLRKIAPGRRCVSDKVKKRRRRRGEARKYEVFRRKFRNFIPRRHPFFLGGKVTRLRCFPLFSSRFFVRNYPRGKKS